MKPELIGNRKTNIRFCGLLCGGDGHKIMSLRLGGDNAEKLIGIWTKAIEDITNDVPIVCEKQPDVAK
jgi:hypothetical protein